MASLQLLELEQPWDGPVRVLHLLSIAKQTDVLLEALKKCATELSWSQIPAVLAGEKKIAFQTVPCALLPGVNSCYTQPPVQ